MEVGGREIREEGAEVRGTVVGVGRRRERGGGRGRGDVERGAEVGGGG